MGSHATNERTVNIFPIARKLEHYVSNLERLAACMSAKITGCSDDTHVCHVSGQLLLQNNQLGHQFGVLPKGVERFVQIKLALLDLQIVSRYLVVQVLILGIEAPINVGADDRISLKHSATVCNEGGQFRAAPRV